MKIGNPKSSRKPSPSMLTNLFRDCFPLSSAKTFTSYGSGLEKNLNQNLDLVTLYLRYRVTTAENLVRKLLR